MEIERQLARVIWKLIPLTPFPLIREGGVWVRGGQRPPLESPPLSFEGEGDTGGEVNNMDYLAETFKTYFDSASKAADNRFNQALWLAWGFGAYVFGQGLQKIPEFGTVPDSSGKAKFLFELCAQPMVSFSAHRAEALQERKSSETEKETARRIAFEIIQDLLGISSEESIRIYIHFDKELRLFIDETVSTTIMYFALFYQRFLECITGERIVTWNELIFPVQSREQIVDACKKGNYKELNLESQFQAFFALTSAVEGMFQEFTRNYGSE